MTDETDETDAPTPEPAPVPAPRADADPGDLRLRDDDAKPAWLATYGPPLWRILLLLALLVSIIVLRKPCADGVAGLVGNFDPQLAQPRDGGTHRGPASGPAPTAAHRAMDGLTPPAGGDAAPRH